MKLRDGVSDEPERSHWAVDLLITRVAIDLDACGFIVEMMEPKSNATINRDAAIMRTLGIASAEVNP